MTEISSMIANRRPTSRLMGLPNTKCFRIAKIEKDEDSKFFLEFGVASSLIDEHIIKKHVSTFNSAKIETDNKKVLETHHKFYEVFTNLEEAVNKRAFSKVNEIASAYLVEQPVSQLSKIDPIFTAVCQFMPDWTGDQATLAHFVSRLNAKQLMIFATAAPVLINILKTQIICAMAIKELGQQSYDLTAMLRSIAAFDIIARQSIVKKEISDFSYKLAAEFIKFDVELPSFLFFKVCDSPLDESKEPSRLSQSLKAKLDYDKSLKSRVDATQCDCDCDDPLCTLPTDCCPELQYFVADYFTLESATKCYVPGDLTYIENVAAFESRTRKHSFEESIENTYEEVVTEENRSKRDLTMTDRATLERTLEKKASLNAMSEGKYGISADKYLLGRVTVTADILNKQVRNSFKESIDKVITEVNRTTVTTRSEVVKTTEKEENTHAFNNDTDKAARSKYFYVNREVQGQVLSYDVRGQIEMFLPKPAAMLEYLQHKRLMQGFKLVKPEKPKVSKDELKPERHDEYITTYQLQGLESPPAQLPILYDSATMNKKTAPTTITIPSGYTATLLERTGGLITKNMPGAFARINLAVAGFEVSFRTDGPGTDSDGTMSSIGSVICTVNHKNAGSKAYITGRIKMEPDSVDYGPWRDELYDAIMAQYTDALEEYETALADYMDKAKTELFSIHPMQLEQMVRTEIKRAAIYMMCEDFETPTIINLKSVPCGAPTINRVEADRYLREKYFWDRAFDWELMMFHFFDYLFGHSACDWQNKYMPSHDVKMYSDFISAGRARLLIPVAKGMEADVAWYVQTGEVWGQTGTPPLNQADPRYINLITEIANSKNCFQTNREGRVEAIFDQTQNPPMPSNQILLLDSDAYWDMLSVGTDQMAIDADLNRYLYIDGERYVISAIVADPASPPNPTQTRWIITLDRIFTGAASLDQSGDVFPNHAFAVGALLVGAPFTWTEWTNMVWIGDVKNDCLPCYPIKC